MSEAQPVYRVGQGFDIHPFAENRALVIGGVNIPHPRGLQGHSDADVLLHALIDALLGAAGLGDIGVYFPSNDAKWRGANSLYLLELAWQEVRKQGYEVVNIDCSLLAEAPRLTPYIAAMKENISGVLGVDSSCCGIKATTAEKLGFIGRGEGLLASAVVLLVKRVAG